MKYSFQFLVVLFFVVSESTFGQGSLDYSHKWDIGVSLILPFERTVDPRFSNIEAKGVGFGARLSIARDFENIFFLVSMDKRTTDLVGKSDYDLKQQSILVEGSVGWLLNNRDDSRIRFGVGLTSIFLSSNRVAESFTNFNKSRESIGIIGLNFRLKNQPTQRNRLRLENSLSIPILSLIRNGEFGTGEGSSQPWVSSILFKNVFLRNSGTAGWQISRINFVGVDYTWVFYEIKSSAKKISASHQIGIKYILSL